MFDEYVKNAEAVLRRSAGEDKRRQAWLAEGDDEDAAGEAVATGKPDVPAPGARMDVYSCDLDRFVSLGGKKPSGWKEAVNIAGWIQIDEMRTLLEIHYD